jgi:DNA-binding LytR/AlgR family response regulator
MPLRIVIIDDEHHSLELLTSYCQKIATLEVMKTFSDPLEALPFLNNTSIDLLITDINMPSLNGLELKQSLLKEIPTILVTAHSEYAMEGFNLDVIDYLLKPVLFPRFLKAINKAQSLITRQQKSPKLNEGGQYIFVKDGQLRKRVNLDAIAYVQAQGDYLIIQMDDSKLMILHTLTDFLDLLPQNNIVRIHRSTILNLAKVDYVNKDHCIILGQDLTIGKTYRSQLLKLLS